MNQQQSSSTPEASRPPGKQASGEGREYSKATTQKLAEHCALKFYLKDVWAKVERMVPGFDKYWAGKESPRALDLYLWAVLLGHKLAGDDHFDAKREPQEDQRKLSTLGQGCNKGHQPRSCGSLSRLGVVRGVLHSSTTRAAAASAAPVGQRRRGRETRLRSADSRFTK